MELRHLRYFLAVAENCHFRNAAEELLVSQPTLSQQIKDLEKELGSLLFERVGRQVRLTQAGETFREYARRALNVLEEGQAALHEFEEMLRGTLTVGVVQTVNAALTPTAVTKFAADFPLVKLLIKELSAGQIEDGVLSGQLDLGISFGSAPGRELETEPLFEEEFVLIVNPQHRLSACKQVRVADLAEEQFCLLDRSFWTRRMIEESFRQAGIALQVAVEMNSVAGIAAVTASGGPPTMLPQLGANDSRLKTIRVERPTPTRSICLLRTKGHEPIRAINEFIKRVRAEVCEKKLK